MNVRDDLTKHEAQRRFRPALRGDRNQCPACGDLFNSSHAFDLHRAGDYSARRCLSVSEMEGKGMARNASGFWTSGLMTDEERARVIPDGAD